MCGICGIIENNGKIPSKVLLREMIDSLYHRGPDSCGYYRDKQAGLGHTRLSIIDLSTGAQPLSNEDETLWITFNGEIFNYLELRDILIAKGHKFKTKSDTETIVHAWEEWGQDCFEKFNGQWAFALWDTRKKELILSRDRHGIRPLYYADRKSRFLFGSEIKALFCDNSLERAFDPDGMTEIFTYWSPVAPKTAYRGICELLPGTFAIYKDSKMTIKPYWEISFQSEPVKSEREYLEILEEKLREACRLRFTRSDVPVGAYLSGGIDSSITASLVSQYTTSLNTFSLRFEDSEFDEGIYQNEMAEKLGTEHHSIMISNRDIGSVFPEVVYYAERPILRTAPAPLFLLSRLVRESGFKVVVTGEGADETLAGYDIFREAKVRRIIAKNPNSSENLELIGQLYPWMERSPTNTPAFAKSFFSKNLDITDPFLSHRTRWETASNILKMFNPDFLGTVSSASVIHALQSTLPEQFSKWNSLQRDQWIEYRTLLSGYILSAQGDRMLMGNSVEGRFPFLDHIFNDFADNLPADLKLNGLLEKYLLKKTFKNIIPESIIHRPKQPYRAPDAQSFFFESGRHEWMEEILSMEMLKEAGIFQPEMVSRFVKKCTQKPEKKMGNTDNMRIVGIISTMLNFKQIIRKEKGPEKKFSSPEHIVDRV
nr:asparagine synthase (glutamine-hydrolyzing) [Spirochaeta isovalerica]